MKRSEPVVSNDFVTNNADDNVSTLNVAPIALASIAVLAVAFSQCPKSIGKENICTKDLYIRLASLKASSFPNTVSSTSTKANSYLQRVDTMNDIIKLGTGDANSVMKYTRDISDLLMAYTNFHQSMIDYYIKILKNTL